MHIPISIHEIEYFAQISKLRLPFSLLIKTEVVTKHEENMVVLKELSLTT